MTGPLKIRIQGSDGLDDAPGAEDFLRQISDFLDLLKDVEQAIAGESGSAIKWRITGASRNSPVEIEATPFAQDFGVTIDQRVQVVEVAVSAGLAQIAAGGPRPPFFSERALERVESMAQRVLNGLAQTEIIFEGPIPDFALTHTVARQTASAVRGILYPVEKPYEEIGSIEGYYSGLERDGFGRGIVRLRHRVTGDEIKCVLTDDALEQVNEHRAGEILKGRRLLVSGHIFYRSLGRVREIRATAVKLRSCTLLKISQLPIQELPPPPLWTLGGLLGGIYENASSVLHEGQR